MQRPRCSANGKNHAATRVSSRFPEVKFSSFRLSNAAAVERRLDCVNLTTSFRRRPGLIETQRAQKYLDNLLGLCYITSFMLHNS